MLLVALFALVSSAWGRVSAAPILQLYIEGVNFRPDDRTWVLELPPSPAIEFRLWAVGATDNFGSIFNVRLSAAYPSSLRSGSNDLAFLLTPATTGGLGGFTDPSTPSVPVFSGSGGPGTTPLIFGSTYLPSHGVFGPDTVWQEFSLGDFTLRDSPIANFENSFPAPTAELGQINVYRVRVSYPSLLPEGTTIHFDVYGVVEGRREPRPVFGPPSHDAEIRIDPAVIPVPPTVLLAVSMGVSWGLARALIALRSRRKKRPGGGAQ
ncbi:MAG: choice-of-anchor N protein [Thermoguttaceae bacterium]|nr:choice-of-anchor N protein [Thermoguttaceae bacterium]